MSKRLLAAACVAIASHAHADSPPLPPSNTAIEFHHQGFDHYFITSLLDEIAALDAGKLTGWSRTGRGFSIFGVPPPAPVSAAPVCRFYIPPEHGDSHFLSASPAECAVVREKVLTDPNFSGYLEETSAEFYIALPNTATGECPAGTGPVYRLWNQRVDSNHRYTTSVAIKAQMLAAGYVAEGYGTDGVVMCAVQ